MTDNQSQPEMKKLFTTSSVAIGGRDGEVFLGRDRMRLKTRPGHSKREGTDPEEMFAAGYAACFLSAMGEVGRRMETDLSAAEAEAFVSLYMKS